MRCPSCGKQLPEDPFYCAYCGAVLRPEPAPLPRVALDLRAVALALAGTAAALPLSVGFWVLAGQLALVSWPQRVALGALVAALSGLLGAGLQGQLRWPLDAQPPRWSPPQLSMVYGLAGAASVVLGAALVGVVVLPVAWGLAVPNIPALLAGATTGLVAITFALPPAALIGIVAGYGLGRLAGSRSKFSAAWGASLAWWLAGSLGGGVAGGFVAARTNLALSTGAYLGAVVQSGLQVVLLPLAAYAIRWYLVLIG